MIKLLYLFKRPSSLLPGIDQTNQVCSNDDQGRVYQNCKFHDPRGRGSYARAWPYKSFSENALFLLKSTSLFPGIDQTNQVCSNYVQVRVYQIVNFKTPGAGVLMLGCGHIVNMHYLLLKQCMAH